MIFQPPALEILHLVWLLAGYQHLENLFADGVAEQPQAVAFYPKSRKDL